MSGSSGRGHELQHSWSEMLKAHLNIDIDKEMAKKIPTEKLEFV